MSTKGEAFAGLSVAVVTPFKGDEVDYDAFRAQIEFQIDAGTNCICPVGTTGESPTLTHPEHERVINFVCEVANKRIKVMPGVGSNSTAEALRLTKVAEAAGADAALQVAPYYNKPTQEGFYQHFKRIAEESGLPQCIYNIPGRTGKNVDPETIIRLAELQNVTMVKEATGSLDQASTILGATNLTVLSGGEHRPPRHDLADRRRRSRRLGAGPEVAPQVVPTLPRHVGAVDEPDPAEGRDEDARPRHRRNATADDAARTRARGIAAEDADGVRVVVVRRANWPLQFGRRGYRAG